MNIDRRKVERALKKKGFILKEDRDHRFYFLEYLGKKTAIFTKVSTGSKYKNIGSNLVSSMARQLYLSKKEFVDLVECSISGSDYTEILIKAKRLSKEGRDSK